MDKKELIDKLNSLIRLDNDALSAYNKAIDAIKEPEINSEVIRFRSDHKRHVELLSDLITKYGGVAAKGEQDVRGFFLGTAATIQSLTGLHGTLNAMLTGEQMTNKNYSQAIEWNVPEDVQFVLKAKYEDEKRHLRFFEKAVADKVWEKR